MNSKKLFACLTLFFTLSGCTTWRPITDKPAPPALPEFYRDYYQYPSVPLATRILGEEKTDSYLMKKVEIDLNLPADLIPPGFEKMKQDNEALFKTDEKTAKDVKLRYTNRLDVYYPLNMKAGEKRPVILISPILGGNMVVDHFARYYAGRGYIAALVYRKRTFWNDGSADLQQIEDYLRTSVIRLRQAVDWIEAQPEADANRIGAFGISYGAILHTVLAAVEPRIRYHVLAMPAGPLPDVIMHCPDKGVSKIVKKVREQYGWPDEQIYEGLKKVIKTDPKLLAPYVAQDKVQVYVAAFDGVVGAGRSFGLWKALGKPTLKILPFGHYGGILVFPYLQTQSYLAFRWHLRKG